MNDYKMIDAETMEEAAAAVQTRGWWTEEDAARFLKAWREHCAGMAAAAVAGERTDASRDPFEEGMAAFNDRTGFGDCDKTNPYPKGSDAWAAWVKGYEAASDGAWDVWKSGA